MVNLPIFQPIPSLSSNHILLYNSCSSYLCAYGAIRVLYQSFFVLSKKKIITIKKVDLFKKKFNSKAATYKAGNRNYSLLLANFLC